MKSKNNKFTAIILAGGQSKRMGFNKEKIKINGEYLVYKQIDTLREVFDEIIVVTKDKNFYKDQNVIAINDILKAHSPLIGLHAGLSQSSNEYNYLIACDMPNIDINYIKKLISKIDSKEAYISKTNGFFEPFQAFYNKSLTSKIEEFIEVSLKFQDFIKSLDYEKFTTRKEHIFINLNSPVDLYKLENTEHTYEEFEIEKHDDVKAKSLTDYVINEYPLTILINNEKYITLLITPKNIKELVIGYLRSEKIIEDMSEIISLIINENEFKVYITLNKSIDSFNSNKDKLLTSGCGVGTRFHDDLDQVVFDSIETDFVIGAEDISLASVKLNNKSGLFKLTGGVHSCLLLTDKNEVYFEDIGRHNAVDKAVGYIFLNNIETKNSYLFSSGRISSDMLLKCAVSAIPIVISRSAPTSLAVRLADKYGITLIGFARGNKFNIYTHPQRVKRWNYEKIYYRWTTKRFWKRRTS